MHLIKQILNSLSKTSLSGSYEAFNFEHRMFNLLCALNLIGFFFSLIINYIAGLAWFVQLSNLVLGAIIGVIYFYSRIKKTRLIFSLGTLVFFDFSFFIFFWFANGGVEGAIPYLFFALQNVMILAIHKPWRLILFTLLLVLALTIIQYFSPQWVFPYPSREAQYFDYALSFIITSLLVGWAIIILKNDFKYQTNFIEVQNQLLKKQNTEIKKQNEMLTSVNQLRNQLFSIIAHDFRSPLQAIHTVMEMLINNELDEASKSKIAAELTSEISYTNSFMDNLLSWTKNQMQENRVFPIDFSLFQLVENNLDLIKLQSQQKNITILNQTMPDIYIRADREMINLVVRNLLSNALKFSYPESKVVVSSEIKGNEVICAVIDKGKGMPPHQQANLFGHQLSFTKGTANEKGSGLGLILCKDFVEKNGGKLWFESQEKVGSIFYFSLPLKKD